MNALVWNRCPKHRQKGFRNDQTAAGAAAIQFNCGASGRHCIMDKINTPAGNATMAGSRKKDTRRVKQSNQRASQKFQEARGKIRNAKLQAEEKRKQAEGVTYQSGGFNEEILSVPVARKRGKESKNKSA